MSTNIEQNIPAEIAKNTKRWYILKTKSNCEKKVYQSLNKEGFEAYLPSYSTIRIWSDRRKEIEVPLIPSYVFVHCEKAKLVFAAKTQGVAWVIRDRDKYAVVKDYEIENLRIFLAEKFENNSENLEDFEIGESVKVTKGPFNGLIGTAIHKQNDYRVQIEISSIGINFMVSVPKSQLEKI